MITVFSDDVPTVVDSATSLFASVLSVFAVVEHPAKSVLASIMPARLNDKIFFIVFVNSYPFF